MVGALVPLLYNSEELERLEACCKVRYDYYSEEAIMTPHEAGQLMDAGFPNETMRILFLQVPVRREINTVRRLGDGRPSRMGLNPPASTSWHGQVGVPVVGPVDVTEFAAMPTALRSHVDKYQNGLSRA